MVWICSSSKPSSFSDQQCHSSWSRAAFNLFLVSNWVLNPFSEGGVLEKILNITAMHKPFIPLKPHWSGCKATLQCEEGHPISCSPHCLLYPTTVLYMLPILLLRAVCMSYTYWLCQYILTFYERKHGKPWVRTLHSILPKFPSFVLSKSHLF